MRWGESGQESGQGTCKQAAEIDPKVDKGAGSGEERKNTLLRFHELIVPYSQLPRFVPALAPKPLSSSTSASDCQHTHGLLTCLSSGAGLVPTSHRSCGCSPVPAWPCHGAICSPLSAHYSWWLQRPLNTLPRVSLGMRQPWGVLQPIRSA